MIVRCIGDCINFHTLTIDNSVDECYLYLYLHICVQIQYIRSNTIYVYIIYIFFKIRTHRKTFFIFMSYI